MSDRKTLLIVDDEPVNLNVLRTILSDDYELLFAKDGQRALTLANTEKPDLILLDIMMPAQSGYEVCAALKANSATRAIPVIFVTALSDADDEARGLELGAADYITKPVNPAIVRARVRNLLSLVHLDELKSTRLAIVQRLGRAAEYKDNETGMHVIRMSHASQIIALAAGCSQSWAENLLNAAPMHDVGKIGIPDAILQKPGKLDSHEWEIMQRHTTIGAEIIGDDGSELLRMAKAIALGHHEKWDGSGYPNGLRGTEIPLEARIVAIADVFDALTSERPYKSAWPVDDAVQYIRNESGRHFDPDLVQAFERCQPAIIESKQALNKLETPP